MHSLIVLVLLPATSIAHSAVHPSKAARVSVEAPDSWRTTETDENVKWISSRRV
jgi:hypothetical protein